MLPQKLKENLNNSNPDNNFCAPHTLINAVKRATLVANYAEEFRSKFQKIIRYPGKARDLARDVFDDTIVEAVGVIFFVKCEQFFQIATHSPKKNQGGILLVCNQKKLVIKVDEEIVTGIWDQGKVI